MAKRVLLLIVAGLVLVVAASVVSIAVYRGKFQSSNLAMTENAIMVIVPYKHAGTWVFDDERTGLSREPFVAGVPEMIDALTKDIPDAEKGFRLTFSATLFPGFDTMLVWRRFDGTGNWYYCELTQTEGWLCPALLRYYSQPPKQIYVKAEAQ